ncbi:Sure-like protein [Pleurostoma richardsiae]|uniref:Sure-like protein n=1 Tax=Pleurostoma richardsiae TaxID=41990 RepID=A0AA38R3M6_9PEZI|nr:Sure-like protein [Pleurostoma richardsiae]
MHILVVNDDGPPSPQSSPYVHSFVRELQAAGHVVSVVLPHTQRSWIGKAHMIGQTVKPLYYRPPPPHKPAAGLASPAGGDDDGPDDSMGTIHSRPAASGAVEEWVLVDGTPASCVQIGLYHFFRDRGPVDLVLSGPNYGRNTTSVFALSSGTLGGALEAAACKRRAIAVSYAFFSRNHDPAIVAAASRHSVRVVEALARQWPEDGSVDLYSVNVPLVEGVEARKTVWAGMLQNYWGEGSCFQEVEGSVGEGGEEEERIREGIDGEVEEKKGGGGEGGGGHTHKHFKWAPRFTDVYRSVDEAPPGNDGWAVREGFTSVTPLKANFWNAAPHLYEKELKLEPTESGTAVPIRESKLPNQTGGQSAKQLPKMDHLNAVVAYEDEYVQPLIIEALQSLIPEDRLTLIPLPQANTPSETPEVSLAKLVPSPEAKILQIMPYETIDFDYAAMHPNSCLVNSYMIRKALIRKHFLSATVDNWVAKHPESPLKTHVRRSEAFEVDYAEFLDDALVEAWDLRASMERNEGVVSASEAQTLGEEEEATVDGRTGGPKDPKDREWWILKPSMSDRGQGIRLFSTMEELQGIFDEWEAGLPESDDEDDDASEGEGKGEDESGEGANDDDDEERDYITASHLRHFVAQPYIHPPLLVDGRKFHIRTYVLSVGSLRVYVYREMLALFAGAAYADPWSSDAADLAAHLTNTCLQQAEGAPPLAEGAVRRFWDLPLGEGQLEGVFAQVCAVTGELFEAAARGMMVHFQPGAGAFEVFGLDFLVDGEGTAWLLEVNAFPDFKQTGGDLRGVVAGFWEGVLSLAVGPFVGLEGKKSEGAGEEKMVLVKEVDLGRR